MKKLLIISFLFFGLISCSSENSNKAPDSKAISETVLDVSKLEVDLFGEIAPEEVLMGDASIDRPVKTHRIFLKNSSESAIPLQISLENGNNFSIRVNRCGTLLAKNSSCYVEVMFSSRPLFSGTNYSSSLKVLSNFEIALKANVIGKENPFTTGVPNLQVEMIESFSDETNSSYRILKYKNIGTQTVKDISFTLPASYSLRLNRCPSALVPQQECVIQVSFKNFRTTNPPEEYIVANSSNDVSVSRQTNLLTGASQVFNPTYIPTFSDFPENTKTAICSGSEMVYKELLSCRNQFNESVALSFCSGFPPESTTYLSPEGELPPTAITGGEIYLKCDQGSSVSYNSRVDCITPQYFENQTNFTCDAQSFIGEYVAEANPVPNVCDGEQNVSRSLISGTCTASISQEIVGDEFCYSSIDELFKSPSGNVVENIPNGTRTLSCEEGSTETAFVSGSCSSGYLYSPETAVGTCDLLFPKGNLGNLIVNNGQVHNVVAGQVYDYESITVQVGGRINITGKGVVLLGSKGDVVINGQITSDKWNDCSGTFSVSEPFVGGTEFSINVSQAEGGNGGAGGASTTTNARAAGGISSCGWGAGGGGGRTNINTILAGAGGSGQSNGGAATNGTIGYGGQSVTTNGSPLIGGNGMGGGGGAGSGSSTFKGGGGGGGGGKGSHSNSLVIKTLGSVSGSGTISLSGLNGTNGSNGGNGTAQISQYVAGAGGGGGGGAGGNGGNLWILYKGSNNMNGSKVILNGGTSGSGGTKGVPSVVSTSWAFLEGINGSPGQPGNAGIFVDESW